jgi:pimeloyl-ACP methyl ester carboxylesterase
MDALKVQNASVLGFFLGLFIARQLAVIYPEKIDSFVLIALYCDGKRSIPTIFRNLEIVIDIINKAANSTVAPSQQVKDVNLLVFSMMRVM